MRGAAAAQSLVKGSSYLGISHSYFIFHLVHFEVVYSCIFA